MPKRIRTIATIIPWFICSKRNALIHNVSAKSAVIDFSNKFALTITLGSIDNKDAMWLDIEFESSQF